MNKALGREFKEIKTRESLFTAKGDDSEHSNWEKGRSMQTSATVVAGFKISRQVSKM